MPGMWYECFLERFTLGLIKADVIVDGIFYGYWEFCNDPGCYVGRHRAKLGRQFEPSRNLLDILDEKELEYQYALDEGFIEYTYKPFCWDGTLATCKKLLKVDDPPLPDHRREICKEIIRIGNTPYNG